MWHQKTAPVFFTIYFVIVNNVSISLLHLQITKQMLKHLALNPHEAKAEMKAKDIKEVKKIEQKTTKIIEIFRFHFHSVCMGL